MVQMFGRLAAAGIVGLLVVASPPDGQAQEIIDPKVAAEDPDFHVQGEYLGTGTLLAKQPEPLGAQVVARGDGKFDVYLLAGGLPGAGWKRGEPRLRIAGQRQGDSTELEGPFRGRIAGGKMTLASLDGSATAELKRIQRQSPTLGAKPPEGAKVLFDGTTAEPFDQGVLTDMKTLMAGCTTKQKFHDYTLHLEFRLSWMPKARGQGRSNSGVYLHDCYEIQVLDSFGLEGEDNECGGLYSIQRPLVNMCLPPMVWQTYDAEFTAPRYDQSGRKVANGRLRLRHNGVVIYDGLLPRNNAGRASEGPGPRPIHLQGHGNKVQYQNIWLVEKP
ncbi:MAG: 3-keto-disaccharide hydrolase [Thermoguttaceae bacterium]